MKLKHIALLLLLAALLLSACGRQTPDPTTAPVPTEPTAPPVVDIGGTELAIGTTALELENLSWNLDALLAAAQRLEAIARIDLGITELTAEQVTALREAFPAAEVTYRVDVLGTVCAPDTTELDLAAMDPADTEKLVAALPLLPNLQQINFIDESGACVYDLTTIPLLDQVRMAAPEAQLHVSFELFGQTVTSRDERIEYYLVPIGNDGAEVVRSVLPYLTSCTYLLMDGCEVDNEVMAQLREDFPETKIVWRVWTIAPRYDSPKHMRWASFLTDTHRIRTVLVNDSTSDVLKYCVETKYVDFGHNLEISDFSFLGYMPQLEAAIIGLTNCADISMLVNCPNLEYLEVYGSKVTDLSPLAQCTNLKHLNISRMQVTDITCLYGLELERFRAVDTKVPKEQIKEYGELHPDCQMLMEGWAPHKNGWRYDDNDNIVPRYALLRQQMEYDIDFEYGIP